MQHKIYIPLISKFLSIFFWQYIGRPTLNYWQDPKVAVKDKSILFLGEFKIYPKKKVV